MSVQLLGIFSLRHARMGFGVWVNYDFGYHAVQTYAY